MKALELAKIVNEGNEKLNIIDLRNPQKFQAYHLMGAKNIDPQKLFFNPDHYLTHDQKYYLICNSNNTASSVKEALLKEGFDVEDVPGGMNQILDQSKTKN